MATERIRFKNRTGLQLAGLIDRPDGIPTRAMAVFAHCFTCTKNLKAVGNIARALNDAGIGVLRFDFTGLGQSEGEFAETTFSNNVSDLVDAAEWLESRGEAPAILIGHSLGGTAMLQAAADIPSAVAVATIGSPATPTHVTQLFADHAADIERDGEAQVLLAGRPFTIRRAFVDDLERHPLAESVHSLRKALLILHSPLDATVSVDNAGMLFDAALHPKSFVSLDNADHLLSRDEDSLYAGTVLAGWASRFLPALPSHEPSVSGERGIVARTGAASFLTDVQVRHHRLTVDEPASVGGTDAGPTPVELLTAALAACTSMTLRMYAQHKQLPLQEARVEVLADREGSGEDTVHVFHRTIQLTGPLTDAQRERMVEIADRCPVHRTLHGTVEVRNTLAPA